MDHFPTNWGRPKYDSFDSNATYPLHNRGQNQSMTSLAPLNTRSMISSDSPCRQPIVTGTSVLAIKFKDGIMMASDTLASASRWRFTVVGASGDMSDFQYLQHVLDGLVISEETTAQDGHTLGPAEIHEYLSQVMYARRSKMNPLWNSLLVGGVKEGQRFLAYVDLLGVTYSASTLATGYGAYIAQPLLRKAVEGRENTLTEPEARAILENALRVLFYRDARSINQYQIATITANGAEISGTLKLETSWGFAEGIRGYGAQTQ
ncbi:proteasome endopeptidase complex beta subunit [Lactarius quietus]|nr:proteasome endopeptidase complex beta subunit [Lactarius quietus]